MCGGGNFPYLAWTTGRQIALGPLLYLPSLAEATSTSQHSHSVPAALHKQAQLKAQLKGTSLGASLKWLAESSHSHWLQLAFWLASLILSVRRNQRWSLLSPNVLSQPATEHPWTHKEAEAKTFPLCLNVLKGHEGAFNNKPLRWWEEIFVVLDMMTASFNFLTFHLQIVLQLTTL